MNLVKRISSIMLLGVMMVNLVGCGEKNVEGKLEDLMVSVYEGIPDDQKPMMLTDIPVTKENQLGFLGTDKLEVKEALASESGVGAIAHSVVLVRVEEGSDVEEVKTLIKESVDPRKWICVEAETVIVDNVGDLVILIMSNEKNANIIHENFLNLSK